MAHRIGSSSDNEVIELSVLVHPYGVLGLNPEDGSWESNNGTVYNQGSAVAEMCIRTVISAMGGQSVLFDIFAARKSGPDDGDSLG